MQVLVLAILFCSSVAMVCIQPHHQMRGNQVRHYIPDIAVHTRQMHIDILQSHVKEQWSLHRILHHRRKDSQNPHHKANLQVCNLQYSHTCIHHRCILHRILRRHCKNSQKSHHKANMQVCTLQYRHTYIRPQNTMLYMRICVTRMMHFSVNMICYRHEAFSNTKSLLVSQYVS